MRIAIICGAGYIAGKEKIMFSLLKGLAEKGDDVFCITSTWGNGQFEQLLKAEKINYAKIRLGFISKTFNWKAFKMTMNQMIYWPKLLLDYRRIVSRFKPDVIIHSNFHHLFLLYPAVKKGKIVNIYHGHETIGNTKFYRRLFKMFDSKMKMFITVSDFIGSKLLALGIDKNKIKTIHNGVEFINARLPFHHEQNIFRLGIAGQVGSWKGHEDLIIALSIVRRNNPGLNFKLYIFGTGAPEYLKKLDILVNENNLAGFVEWKGFVNDISEIYKHLDIVCIPSRCEEALSTSSLEAGLFALPVLVTNKGGFPEIVKPGYNGFIVAPNAPEEIAGCIETLVKDPALMRQMGLNHKQCVTEKFSFSYFIHNWQHTLSLLAI